MINMMKLNKLMNLNNLTSKPQDTGRVRAAKIPRSNYGNGRNSFSSIIWRILVTAMERFRGVPAAR